MISTGIKEELWAFRKGFYLVSIRINGIRYDDVNEYLPDRTNLRLHPINKVYSVIIGYNSIIGADATVSTDIPDNYTLFPPPSRIMRREIDIAG